MPRDLFIAGTDTGVGKTLVTALLALHWRARGIDCGVFKPFATGCLRQGGALLSEDALFLRDATGVDDSLDLICPIRLEEPLAPLVAARRAGLSTADWPEHAREALRELKRRHECVLVEGVGGLLVPVAERAGRIVTCADLAGDWALPTVVVARRRLGTINHTLLTCRTPLRPPAVFAGLIFCDAEPVHEEDVAAHTSPALLAEMTGLPIWGQVPHRKIDAARLEELAASLNSVPE